MLHPSYTDLMQVVNSEVEQGEQPLVQSRYSIVLATAKRARQIIAGQVPLVRSKGNGIKPLSVAVDELSQSKIKILTDEEAEEYARIRKLQIEEAKKARRAEKLRKMQEEQAALEAEADMEEAMDAEVTDEEADTEETVEGEAVEDVTEETEETEADEEE